MNIPQAYQTFEARLAQTANRSEKKVLEPLLGALNSLKERTLSTEQRRSIEEAIDRELLHEGEAKSANELKKGSKDFIKQARELLSLLPEHHYTGLGMVFGVAFGGLMASLLQGVAGIPEGASGTGTGIGLGLIAGLLIGAYLDLEAAKQNRVLKTSTR